jgi:carboxyl-terminal processing protease
MLEGFAGERMVVKVLDADDKTQTLTLTFKPTLGEPSSFGGMPTLYATIEARRLPSGIGYLRFNAFMLPLIERITAALDSFHGAKGIVVDLRGNPGGIGGVILPIAGRLVQKPTLLGVSRMRAGEYRDLVYPQKPHFAGPVAILVDEASASASEMLAGGLQECGRAIVVGRTTAGEVLPSSFEKLPDGSRLQYVVAVFHTPKGVLLEGRGVIPDVPVELTREALLAGNDPVLDAAVAAILKKTRGVDRRQGHRLSDNVQDRRAADRSKTTNPYRADRGLGRA